MQVTTLIAAIILFALDQVSKGFAITLGMGTTTLFTAYFLARHLTSIVVLRIIIRR